MPKPKFSTAFVQNSIITPLAEVEATEAVTTVIHLGKNDIDRFKVVIPEAGVLGSFNRIAQPLLDKIVVNKQQCRTLAAIRDALLPKLLSGAIRVNEADRLAASGDVP
jgi:type I restriction enzyme S subunit